MFGYISSPFRPEFLLQQCPSSPGSDGTPVFFGLGLHHILVVEIQPTRPANPASPSLYQRPATLDSLAQGAFSCMCEFFALTLQDKQRLKPFIHSSNHFQHGAGWVVLSVQGKIRRSFFYRGVQTLLHRFPVELSYTFNQPNAHRIAFLETDSSCIRSSTPTGFLVR